MIAFNSAARPLAKKRIPASTSKSASCSLHHQQSKQLLLLFLFVFGCGGRSVESWALGSSHSSSNTWTTTAATRMSETTTHDTTIPRWRTLRALDDDRDTGVLQQELSRRGQWAAQADALDLARRLQNCTDPYISPQITEALRSLTQAYRLYGPESVISSFNGGKDAVVILHLVRAAHALYHHDNNSTAIMRPRVVYFDHPDEFPAVKQFVRDTVEEFDLEMIAFGNGTTFVQGLEILVENNHVLPKDAPGQLLSDLQRHQVRPVPMAFVLGTRSDDPNAVGQGTFAPSSSSYMPPFMRVNPILQWTYGHVWHFLRLFGLPYCSLYDQGYTSLGTTRDTNPCPALRKEDSSYWPAYMLRDYSQERAGRKKKKPKVEDGSNSSIATTGGRLSTYSTGIMPKEITTTRNNSSPVNRSDGDDEDNDDDEDPTEFTYNDGVRKTAGVVIIGDEILKGLTPDTNSRAAALALRQHNVALHRVAVVSDDRDEIVREIHRMKREVDVIITSGGVGPTHDDVTITSVADALGCDLVLHEGMVDLLKQKMQTEELTLAQRKMATLPASSKLRYLSSDTWPVLQCRNIFVLPGVPEYFGKKIEGLAEYLSCQLQERSIVYKVVLSKDEDSIVTALNQVVENHPGVVFGSYPFVNTDFKTVITVEGRLLATSSNSQVYTRDMIENVGRRRKEMMDRNVELALDDLIQTLPEGSVLRVDTDDQLLG